MVTDEIWTVREVADYLKVSRTTIWRWCHQGKLPAFKIGRGWRVHRSEVEKLMEEGRAKKPKAAEEPSVSEEKRSERPVASGEQTLSEESDS